MHSTKDIIDSLIENVVSTSFVEGLGNRAPLYSYGWQGFDVQLGTTPQVRVAPGSFSLSPPFYAGGQSTNPNIPVTSGSLCTFNQNVSFMIWGKDEKECMDEFRLILLCIDNMKGVLNPPGISQPSWIDITGRTRPEKARDTQGIVYEFDWQIRTNIPNGVQQIATIVTSSTQVTGSNEYLLTDTMTYED